MSLKVCSFFSQSIFSRCLNRVNYLLTSKSDSLPSPLDSAIESNYFYLYAVVSFSSENHI